jgi:shikimate dehydrogenase
MRQFGLIGRTLKHSFSADYFAAKFRNEQINDCSYTLYELPSIDNLQALLDEHPQLEGLNVTIPYKQQIMEHLDSMTDEAWQIGAVNCVRRTAGGLCGYNTDIEGIRATLHELVGDDYRGTALVLGSGGASRAVQYALGEAHIPFQVVSRTTATGDITYSELTVAEVRSHRLIINATPLGTYPNVDEAPNLPYQGLTSAHALFDLVYNPAQTCFLQHGMRAGAHTHNGQLMLEVQAEASWRIWNK